MLRKKFWLLVVFLLSFSGCGQVSNPPTKVGDLESKPPLKQIEIVKDYKIGDLIRVGDIELVAYDLTFSEGESFFKPKEGNIFALVHLSIKNISDKTTSVSSMLMFELRDKNGVKYDESFSGMSIVSSSIGGVLFPKKVMRGEICFEVPKNIIEPELQVNPEVFGTKNVFSIGLAEKISDLANLSMPKSEKGEKEFSIGDVVKVNNLEYTVHGVRKTIGEQYFGPDVGNEFLVIDVSVTNRDSKTQAVSSLIMYSLRDVNGYAMSETMGSSIAANGNLSGDILPGKTLRGEVGFEVPIDVSGLELAIEPNAFDSNSAFIVVLN